MTEDPDLGNSRRRGVALYLRLGVIGLSALSILTLLAALYFFSRMAENISRISRDTLPVLELARDLTHRTKSIEADARHLANLRQPFRLQSLTYKMDRELDGLSQTIAKLDTRAVAAERLQRMNALIGEIRQAVDRLKVLVSRTINGEARYRRYGRSLVQLTALASRMHADLSAYPDVTLEQRRIITDKLYETLKHAFVSMSTVAPREVVPSKVAFLFGVSELEILLRDLDLPRSSPVWDIPPLLRGVENMFDDRMDLMRTRLHAQGAVRRLVIIEKLIGLSLDIAQELTEEARTQAVTMQNRAVNLVRVIAAVVVVSVILVVLVNLFINWRIVRRMKRLQQTMLAHVKGSDADIDVSGRDEITDMATSFRYFVQEVKSRERSLQERSAQLEDAYEIISDSITYASRIQRSFLPDHGLIREIFDDYFVIWEPRDVVGGDVYWWIRWGDGHLIMLGDCTGHGVPGALMTLITTGALDRALIGTTPGDVGTLLAETHRLVRSGLGQDGDDGESDDGMELGLCYLPPDRRRLVFAGARFDLYMVGDGGVSEFRGSKKGIGYRAIPHDQRYPETVVPLRLGQRFYLTSDGLIDQVGGERHRMFGRKRFKNLLLSVQSLPLKDQGGKVMQSLLEYQGDETRRDDLAVIGFSIDLRAAS